ncbi:MAG: two-component regulator propeller domain-containing protein [Pseudomonadota bacterium]
MHKILAGLLTALLCSTAHAFSQDHFALVLSPASSQLSQSTVVDIYQDARGFVWVLTEEGLNRFDGSEVVVFRSRRGDESFLSNDSTSALVEDDKGTLWVATLGGGINRFDEKNLTFEHLKAGASVENSRPLSNFVTTLKKGADGYIWVGYAGGVGFSRFDPLGTAFTHYFIPGQAANMDVEGFAETEDGRLIIAVANYGLLELDTSSAVISPLANNYLDFQPSNPSAMVDLGDGQLLITSGDAGAFVYDTTSSQLYRHPLHEQVAEGSALKMYSAMQDSEGNHWFGTSEGVAVYSADGALIWFNTFNSALPDNNVLAMLEGDDGSYWLGTFSGLASGGKASFQKLTEDDGLASNDVNSVFAEEGGRWWIGTGSGLTALTAHQDSRGDWIIDSVSSGIIADQQVMSLHIDDEFVWAGTIDNGLFRISRMSGEIKNYFPDGQEWAITSAGVAALARLPSGGLLVGTYGGGLNLFDPRTERFVAFTTSDDTQSISDDRVLALLTDSQGKIWVGTQYGLNLFDEESQTFRRFVYEQNDPSTLSDSTIFALAEDVDGTIWIGTRSGGVNLLAQSSLTEASASFSRLPPSVGTLSSAIFSIQIANDGAAWVTGSTGLTRIRLDSLSVQRFDNRDGTLDGEFLTGASGQSPDGELFFGGVGGVNIIERDWTEPVIDEPRVYVTGFNLLNEPVFFDRPYSELRSIQLENDYQFASLSFTAVEFKKPESVNYRYRIDGLHNEWIDLGGVRQAFISGVPYGDYQLRIAASKSDGTWSEAERRIGVQIAPPIWLTWYAFVAYFLLFVAVALSVANRQRARAREELGRRLELEEKVEERTRDLSLARNEAEAAAKAKADFLAAMSHEIRTPMHGMIGMTDLLLQSGMTKKQREYAQTAKQSGHSLLDIINSILDYSKLEAGKLELSEAEFDLVGCVDDVAALLALKAKEQNTRLIVLWEQCPSRFIYGDEGKLRQILLNLVGNAIKFTKDGEVKIVCNLAPAELSEQPGNLEEAGENLLELDISVIDTGIGISPHKIDSIFEVFTQEDASTTRQYGGTGLGLSISKELSELMRGSLSVESKPRDGSKFTLNVQEVRAAATENKQNVALRATVRIGDELLKAALTSKLQILGVQIADSENETAAPPELFVFDVAHQPELAQQSGTEKLLFVDPNEEKGGPSGSYELHEPYRVEELWNIIQSEDSPVSSSTQRETDQANFQNFEVKVLLVEDIPINQVIACEMLQRLGADITVAKNGLEAIAQFKKTEFDLVLMDCQMPLMDGYEATRKIREYETSLDKDATPIYALSAGGEGADEELALDAGMAGFLRKPFTAALLAGVLEKVASSKSTESTPAAEIADMIDEDVVENFRSLEKPGENSLVTQLLDGYREQAWEKLGELSKAIASADTEEIRKSAHALKSMSANIGAVSVKKLAERIEQRPETYKQSSFCEEEDEFSSQINLFISAFSAKFGIDSKST